MAEGGPSGPTGEKSTVSFAEEPKMCWHVHTLAEGFTAHWARAMKVLWAWRSRRYAKTCFRAW